LITFENTGLKIVGVSLCNATIHIYKFAHFIRNIILFSSFKSVAA